MLKTSSRNQDRTCRGSCYIDDIVSIAESRNLLKIEIIKDMERNGTCLGERGENHDYQMSYRPNGE